MAENFRKPRPETLALAVQLNQIPDSQLGFYSPEGVQWYRGATGKMVEGLKQGIPLLSIRVANYFESLFSEWNQFGKQPMKDHPECVAVGDLEVKYTSLVQRIETETGAYAIDPERKRNPNKDPKIEFNFLPRISVSPASVASVLNEYGEFYAPKIPQDSPGKSIATLDSWFLIGTCMPYVVIRRQERGMKVSIFEPPVGDFKQEELLRRVNALPEERRNL